MSRYAQVDRSMWVDERFLSLSAPKPSAQGLFIWLLTSPDAAVIPGTFRIGLAGIAEALGWPVKTTGEKLAELVSAGMVRADLKARLVWLPNALKRNEPRAPDNLRPWGKAWEELPECPLKAEVWEAARGYFEARGSAFSATFEALCPHPYATRTATPKPPPMGSAPAADGATHSPAPINKILDPDPGAGAADAPSSAPRSEDPAIQAILGKLTSEPSLASLATLETAHRLVAHVHSGTKKLPWVLVAIGQYAADAAMSGAQIGDTRFASGLRKYVENCRAPAEPAAAGGTSPPRGGRPPEGPSVASQQPFFVAPRDS